MLNKHFLLNLYEYIILFLIFILSSITTYLILKDNISISTINYAYVLYDDKTNYDNINLQINFNENKDTQNISNQNNTVFVDKSDFYTISDGVKTFMVSDTEGSYNYGFITRKRIGDVSYLFSHNSYKYTENSGYYIYNNWKEGTIITIDNGDKYKIEYIKFFDFNKNNFPKNMDMSIKMVYFTCTPFGDNIRKRFFLKKITN